MSILFWLTTAAVTIGTGWCICRTSREFETSKKLSQFTASLVWIVYLVHVCLTTWAAWSGMWRLPVPTVVGIATGLPVLAIGAWLVVTGVGQFASLERMSGRKEDRLIVSGIYRYSRNPQNVGWGVVLLGISLIGTSGAAVMLSGMFWIAFRLYVPIEERHLERVFGAEYREYRKQTSRYLGKRQLENEKPAH